MKEQRCTYSELGILRLGGGHPQSKVKKDRMGTILPFKKKVHHNGVRVRWDDSKVTHIYHPSFITILP
jgi:hypothetical protein